MRRSVFERGGVGERLAEGAKSLLYDGIYQGSYLAYRGIGKTGLGIEYVGQENVPDGGAILAFEHRSWPEIFAVGIGVKTQKKSVEKLADLLFPRVTMIYKLQFLETPILGWLTEEPYDGIMVRRNGKDTEALQKIRAKLWGLSLEDFRTVRKLMSSLSKESQDLIAKDRVARGYKVGWAIEGGRGDTYRRTLHMKNPGPNLGKFSLSVARIARQSQAPTVAVSAHGFDNAFNPSKYKRGVGVVAYAKPKPPPESKEHEAEWTAELREDTRQLHIATQKDFRYEGDWYLGDY